MSRKSVALKNWRTIKLGEITTSYAGGTPLRTNVEYYNGGTIPWIKSGEVNTKYIFNCEERITEKAVKESSAKLFSSNSVLVAMYGATAGQTAICKIEATANQAVLAVNSKDKETTNEYIYYLLSFLAPIILLRSQGSGQPNLSKQILEEQELALPPLNEQKKIAEILTSVDHVIELTSMEIDKLKDSKKGLMQELLTKGVGHTKFKDSPVGKIPESWEVVRLGEIAIFRNGLNFNASNAGTGVKVVGVGDFKDYEYPKLDMLPEINPEGVVSIDDYLKENDFIFVRSNGNRQLIGRSMMIKNIGEEKISFSGFVIRCRLIDKKNVFPDFIKHILKSGVIRTAISDEGAGTNISNLNQQILSALNIVLPPREEQLEISKLLESINIRIEMRKKYLASLEFIKKGLMNDLLTGKVRVRV